MTPRVSLGVPVYNGEQFLGPCLESILGQTFGDFDVIIADNASTDGTWECCQEFARQDRRIRLLRNDRNLGAARNYNLVLDHARGAFFKWMPHDDVIAPEFLQICHERLTGTPEAVLVYPATVMIDGRGEPTGGDPIDHLEIVGSTPHQRLREYFYWSWKNPGCNAVLGLIRTAVLKGTAAIGPYPSSDKVLLAELAMHGQFLHLSEELFFRRDHTASSLKTHPDMLARATWFSGDASPGLHSMEFRWFWEYVRAVGRASHGPEYVRCLGAMSRYYQLHGHKMRREIKRRLAFR